MHAGQDTGLDGDERRACGARKARRVRVGRAKPARFQLPDLSSDARYVVTLTYPDGQVKSRGLDQNWMNWHEVLPPGKYIWRVQVTNAAGTQTSRTRRFTVDPDEEPATF